jgi:hypothetical protein
VGKVIAGSFLGIAGHRRRGTLPRIGARHPRCRPAALRLAPPRVPRKLASRAPQQLTLRPLPQNHLAVLNAIVSGLAATLRVPRACPGVSIIKFVIRTGVA